MPYMSEESSRTSLITHQNMEFSQADINLESGIGVKIISYTGPIASLLALGIEISFLLHYLY